MEGRIFGGNEETMISMTGRKETCLEFIPPPTEKGDPLVRGSNIKF